MEEPPQPKGTFKVHVSGFPTYTQPQDLVRVFESYGSVKVDKISNKFALLNFSDADDAKEAIDDTNKVNIYGEFLTVRAFSSRDSAKQNAAKKKQKGAIVEPRLISLAGDFHSQLDSVLNAVRLTQEEVTKLSALYADLERYLQQLWPGCVALPFGSITTGLGIKSSDADCFIQLPAVFRHPDTNFVNKAKKLLQKYPRAFAEVLAIPRANTPIVKCFHVPTAVHCDLTFKTPLGARNSRLIAFLLHADPRLVPVAVVLKYWAKVHGLSGTGKLSNYALTMLIIFYLQQPEAILPSVEWLQRDSSDDVIIDSWNTGFKCNHELLPKTKNTSPISELLGGFFQYYSSFDFDKKVACPLTGSPLAKELFTDLNNLPPVFERYKRNVMERSSLPLKFTTSMCVQDPIDLSHNVACSINSRLAFEIKAYFKFAADAYEKEKENGCTGFLKILLLQKPKLPRKENLLEYKFVLYPHILQFIDSADWKTVVREIMMQLFEMCKICLTKVEEKPIEGARNQRERYTGTIVKAIWKRKQFTKLYSCSNLSFITKQTRITEEVMKVVKESFRVNFQLTLTYAHNSRNVLASIKLIEGEVILFLEFGKFFKSSFQDWFLTLLRPYILSKDKANAPVANGSSRESDSQATDNTEDKPAGIQDAVVTREDSDSSSENIPDTINNTIDTNDNNTEDPKDRATDTKNSKDIATDTKHIKDIDNDTKYNANNDTNGNDTNDNKTSTQ
ncbi:speckle targeted PIP5K1A-regulated poly(A) polymerase-like isoform X1 [Pararge aegeria]|uniref:Speckle targeted PIP5K1A-regulated poly(A) polymerase n=1 Tax=Pararge aegeria aegeria TaxID=348720 RepID=A0A8S4RQ02_9NEOP|nr:speckle targeted PIP5K1A-regulated poly(A) polymerase-like isoform X1 [Pararge aegeria]CAH2239633.1 jg3203 [Pararge aegeria aegeria]